MSASRAGHDGPVSGMPARRVLRALLPTTAAADLRVKRTGPLSFPCLVSEGSGFRALASATYVGISSDQHW